MQVFDRNSLVKVRTLWGHDDHVWSIDMNQEYIVSGSWDSSVRIWDRTEGRLLFLYSHPHGREISGVKICRDMILVTSLAGSLNVLKRVGRGAFVVEKFFSGCMELGEIYSLACDTNHLITGHTLTSSAFKVWSTEDFEVVKIIKVQTLDLFYHLRSLDCRRTVMPPSSGTSISSIPWLSSVEITSVSTSTTWTPSSASRVSNTSPRFSVRQSTRGRS